MNKKVEKSNFLSIENVKTIEDKDFAKFIKLRYESENDKKIDAEFDEIKEIYKKTIVKFPKIWDVVDYIVEDRLYSMKYEILEFIDFCKDLTLNNSDINNTYTTLNFYIFPDIKKVLDNLLFLSNLPNDCFIIGIDDIELSKIIFKLFFVLRNSSSTDSQLELKHAMSLNSNLIVENTQLSKQINEYERLLSDPKYIITPNFVKVNIKGAHEGNKNKANNFALEMKKVIDEINQERELTLQETANELNLRNFRTSRNELWRATSVKRLKDRLSEIEINSK